MNTCYFIKIIEGNLILWDYLNQKQFQIEMRHVDRLLALSQGAEFGDGEIDQEFRDAGLTEDGAPDWKGGILSRLFHLGTQVVGDLPDGSTEEAYIDWSTQIAQAPVPLLVEPEGELYDLPSASTAALDQTSLWQTLQRRRTCRDFNGEPTTLQQIADVLFPTFGFIHGSGRPEMRDGGFVPLGNRRSSPGAGSIQATEPYLVSLSIEGLPQGIYHYRANSHQLAKLDVDFDPSMLGRLLGGQMYANDLAFGIVLTTRFDKMFWKYPGDRAYRMMLTDLGCLTQTFQLVCTASRLESWMTGCLFEREFNRMLKLDEDNESAMFFLGAGHGSGLPYSRSATEIVRARNQPS